jgi:hypothetical protein
LLQLIALRFGAEVWQQHQLYSSVVSSFPEAP